VRNDVRDGFAEGQPLRVVNYVGDFAVVTGANPEFADPMAAIRQLAAALAGRQAAIPPVFLTLVVYVGEGTLGEAMEDLEANLRLEQTHGDFEKSSGMTMVEKDVAMTRLGFEGHDLVLDQVKGGMFSE
jgi:hypothetical protein